MMQDFPNVLGKCCLSVFAVKKRQRAQTKEAYATEQDAVETAVTVTDALKHLYVVGVDKMLLCKIPEKGKWLCLMAVQ